MSEIAAEIPVLAVLTDIPAILLTPGLWQLFRMTLGPFLVS